MLRCLGLKIWLNLWVNNFMLFSLKLLFHLFVYMYNFKKEVCFAAKMITEFHYKNECFNSQLGPYCIFRIGVL